MIKQVSYFLIIGTFAFSMHMLCLILLVEVIELNKYLANVIAFCYAFNISYFGHKLVTFANGEPKSHNTLLRFFATALVSITINQAVYSFFLGYTHLPYVFSMIIAAGLTAMSTFIISKYYVFN